MVSASQTKAFKSPPQSLCMHTEYQKHSFIIETLFQVFSQCIVYQNNSDEIELEFFWIFYFNILFLSLLFSIIFYYLVIIFPRSFLSHFFSGKTA